MNDAPVIPYDVQLFQSIDHQPIAFTWDQAQMHTLSEDEHGSVWQMPISIEDLEGGDALHQEKVNQGGGGACQVFCRFPQPTFELEHFPHFLQQAYPCWSLLQRFAVVDSSVRQYFYIILPTTLSEQLTYIQSVLRAMRESPLHIRILYANESLPVEKCDATTTQQPNGTRGPSAVLVEKDYSDSGWNRPTRYFMSDNLENDIRLWQQAVLGAFYQKSHPSADTAMRMNVLLLDRKGSTRAFRHGSKMKRMLEASSLAGVVSTFSVQKKVKYVASFSKYTLQQQAQAIHDADIIFSPHGAQLSNLIYIRPCTVVVEFFPRSYYLQFFQSLVVVARGLSYEAYPSDGDKLGDTNVMLQSNDPDAKGKTRSGTIDADPESVAAAFPKLVHAALKCREELG
jgi:Glycosyltransferase 61